MSTGTSPENERFLQPENEAGAFRSRDDAIEAGIAMLRHRKELRPASLKGVAKATSISIHLNLRAKLLQCDTVAIDVV